MPNEEAVGVPEARQIFQNYPDDHPNHATTSAGLVASFAILGAYKCRH